MSTLIKNLKLNDEELEKELDKLTYGNEKMKNFIKNCINLGIEVGECKGCRFPYVDLYVNEENIDTKIEKILQVFKDYDTQIVGMVDGYNPFSGETWYMPFLEIVSLTNEEDVSSRFFENINFLLKKRKYLIPDCGMIAFLKLFEFLSNKESGLTFSIKHQKDTYSLTFTLSKNDYNYKSLVSLLKKGGLTLVSESKYYETEDWGIVEKNYDTFTYRLIKISYLFEEEYSLKLPLELHNYMEFPRVARIIQRRYGDTIEGKKEFKNWLYEEFRKMLKKCFVDRGKKSI